MQLVLKKVTHQPVTHQPVTHQHQEQKLVLKKVTHQPVTHQHQEQKLVLKKVTHQPRQALQVDVVEEIVVSNHYLMYALYNIC
jgi:hypothetical protein